MSPQAHEPAAIKRFPTPDDARAARDRIAKYVRRTPVFADDGTTYKFEFLQVTGSFKPRGAFNMALQLDDESRKRGIVGVSGGNHGLAVAHVGNRLGIRATVFMPASTPAFVVDRARADNAEVVLTPTIAEAFAGMEERRASGQVMLHPYDDEQVMAGQGTIGLELLEDIPDLGAVVTSIGGGGMLVGVAAVVKALRPSVRVFGVETLGADAMHLAREAGKVVTLPAITSIARTLGAPYVCETTLEGTRRFVEDVVVVPDADAVRSILMLQRDLHVTVEPAAACCHAALRLGLIPRAKEGTTAVILCGANVTLDEIVGWRDSLLAPGKL